MNRYRYFSAVLLGIVISIYGCSDYNPLGPDDKLSGKPGNGVVIDYLEFASGAVDNVKLVNGVETVYEDAEDGSISRWFKDHEDAIIMNLLDIDKGSRVIAFFDNDTGTEYLLGNGQGSTFWNSLWNNTSQLVLSWEGMFRYTFEIRVLVEIQPTGYRTLYYTPVNTSLGFLSWGSGYVHIGLGDDKFDGECHTFTRNLQEDLNSAPKTADLVIKAVHGFKIRCQSPSTPPPPPLSDPFTIGFWSSNIKKLLEGRDRGIQVSETQMNGYLNLVRSLALSPFAELTLWEAYEIMKSTDNTPINLLKKQLLAAEFNYVSGAYMNGNEPKTLEMITLGETMLLNPSEYTREQILALKDLFDDFNNRKTVTFP